MVTVYVLAYENEFIGAYEDETDMLQAVADHAQNDIGGIDGGNIEPDSHGGFTLVYDLTGYRSQEVTF